MAEQIVLSGQFDLENVYRRCASGRYHKLDPIMGGGFTFWPNDSDANFQFWARGKVLINTGEHGDPAQLIHLTEILLSEPRQPLPTLRLEKVLVQNRTKTHVSEAALRKADGDTSGCCPLHSSLNSLDAVIQLERVRLLRIQEAMKPEVIARRKQLWGIPFDEEAWNKEEEEAERFFQQTWTIRMSVPCSLLPGSEEWEKLRSRILRFRCLVCFEVGWPGCPDCLRLGRHCEECERLRCCVKEGRDRRAKVEVSTSCTAEVKGDEGISGHPQVGKSISIVLRGWLPLRP